ncbi:MAG TPA: hypothetical protein VHA37_00210 [Candidatus Saccharimonadales bacterium]|nr:hypothetical protein [Candidatus Saccharimonadales bacterium]
MLVLSFLSWWYGRGWKEVLTSFGPRLRSVLENFSVVQLLRTLFEPWRRIVTSPGSSLADKFHAWGDNMVSRGVGFTVRAGVLIGAALAVVLVIILTAVELVIWPLLPLAVPGCLIVGLL